MRLNRLTRHDVLVDDLHVVVPIGPRMFVPEANYVAKFMDNNAKLITVLAYGDRLASITTLANK